ncbi:MAG: hypothetical protein JSV26_04140 [bacterium]|nr:MAG: hypothetical protein JSV26_04140 [bacterium]
MKCVKCLALTILFVAPSVAWGGLYGGYLEIWDDGVGSVMLSTGPGAAVKLSADPPAWMPDAEAFLLKVDWPEYAVAATGSRGAAIPSLDLTGLPVSTPATVPEDRTRYRILPDPDGEMDVIAMSPDMATMVSYLWAEMFTGVDIVRELRIFAERMRRDIPGDDSAEAGRDCRPSWKWRFSYRTADDLEVIARFSGRGDLAKPGMLTLEVNAADVLLHEIGISASLRENGFGIELDDVELNNTMLASLTMEF